MCKQIICQLLTLTAKFKALGWGTKLIFVRRKIIYYIYIYEVLFPHKNWLHKSANFQKDWVRKSLIGKLPHLRKALPPPQIKKFNMSTNLRFAEVICGQATFDVSYKSFLSYSCQHTWCFPDKRRHCRGFVLMLLPWGSGSEMHCCLGFCNSPQHQAPSAPV